MGGGGGLPYKKDWGSVLIFYGLKRRVWYLFRELLWLLLGYWAEINTTGDNVLFQNWYPLGMKNISSHAYKTEFWYILVFCLKNTDEQPRPFYKLVPSLWVWIRERDFERDA